MQRTLPLLLTPLLLLAGCFGDKPSTPTTQEPTIPTAPQPFNLTVNWNGNVPTEAWVCAVLVCLGGALTKGDMEKEIKLNGTLTTVDVKLTWTPASPLTNELDFYAFKVTSDGNGQMGEEMGSAHGASPLAISLKDLNVTAQSLVLVVWHNGIWAGPVGGGVTTDQPFTVKGQVTIRPEEKPEKKSTQEEPLPY